MSAAAARRRKQLLARIQQKTTEVETGDAISDQLVKLLDDDGLSEESTAYEALQLAQSQVSVP